MTATRAGVVVRAPAFDADRHLMTSGHSCALTGTLHIAGLSGHTLGAAVARVDAAVGLVGGKDDAKAVAGDEGFEFTLDIGPAIARNFDSAVRRRPGGRNASGEE